MKVGTDWGYSKSAFIQCFSEKRDLDCLLEELTITRQSKTESMNDFGARLQLLRNSIVQCISNDIMVSLENTLLRMEVKLK